MILPFLQADTAAIVNEAAPQAIETAANPASDMHTMSFLELFSYGGVIMWILLGLSIIAIYILGKKWWMLRRASKIDNHFMQDIRDYVSHGKFKSAASLCQQYDSPVARMVEEGIHRIGRQMNDIQTAVENAGNVEVARLEKGLPILASIAGGAPMIGFLGTVWGMIQAFFTMSKAGNNLEIDRLADGIYTAMVTTVGGLVVGIIAYFGYNWLTSMVSNLVYKMESSTMEFIDIVLHEPEEAEIQ